MKFVGIDGCPKGWFLVLIERNQSWSIDVSENIKEVWQKCHDSTLILIDIPIGLPHWRSRLCDVEARKMLKKRGSSVFPAPSREAIIAENYEEACKANHRVLGKKISLQTWYILPKIKEVDDLFCDEERARDKIRESHPEICLWALAGGIPMSHPKKTRQGLEERLEVVKNIYPPAEKIYYAAIEQFSRKHLAKDDILDAMALAITASSPGDTLSTLPQHPVRDKKNLAMEIVYNDLHL